MAKFTTFIKTKKMLVFFIVLASVIITIVALNVTSGEKKIEKKIEELYNIHDPQFLQ